jgi:hypothetical protein
MGLIELTQNENYRLGKFNGEAVVTYGSDHVQSIKKIKNSLIVGTSPGTEGNYTKIYSSATPLYLQISSSDTSKEALQIRNIHYSEDADAYITFWSENEGALSNNYWAMGIDTSKDTFCISNSTSLNDPIIEIESDEDIFLRTDSVRISKPGSSCGLEIGYNASGNASGFIDFWAHGSTSDWDARIIREAGEDGAWVFRSKGEGFIKMQANNTSGASFVLHDDGEIQFGGNYAGEMFEIKNDGNNDNREGISIECGLDTNPGTGMAFIAFRDGNGDGVDWLVGDGSGGARFTGKAAGTYSDIRNKNSINPIGTNKSVSDILDSIEVFEFKYNSYDWMPDEQKAKKDSEIRIGVSAQQVEEILPEVVWDNDGTNIGKGIKVGEKGYKWKEVKYEEFVPLLLQSRKEQNNKIKVLEDKINKLEEMLNANNS